jgi:hypothetical protein
MSTTESAANRRTRVAHNLELQIRRGLALCAILVVLGLGCIFYGWVVFSPLDRQSISSFGSYVAGIFGSIITFASAILIYIAFVGQRLEAHQRQQEIDLSVLQMATQQFENLFVSFLGFHYETVKSIAGKFDEDNEIYRGRVFFDRVYQELVAEYKKTTTERSSSQEAAIAAYESIYKRYAKNSGTILETCTTL